jgi:hypothetical protein
MSSQKQTGHSKIPEKAAQWLVTQVTLNEKDRINLLGPRQGKSIAASAEEMVHIISHKYGISTLRRK